MIAGMNPWLAMWSLPRSTVKALVHTKPSYGVYSLSTIFVLQTLFSYINWYSLGIKTSTPILFFVSIILSPFIGVVWLYFMGWVFHFTGRWLTGEAPMAHLRTCLAWSKIPTSINLLVWILLIFLTPNHVFVLNSSETSFIFIQLITLITSVWSYVLLIQTLREIQGFSILRSVANIFIAFSLSAVIFLFSVFVIRFLFIY